jgi:hypothetical protein
MLSSQSIRADFQRKRARAQAWREGFSLKCVKCLAEMEMRNSTQENYREMARMNFSMLGTDPFMTPL